MKTLNRPMFNMGGPIKQGVMHGIREPYAHGTRAALVGNPIFPKDKTGRAHHQNPYVLAGMGISKLAPRVAPHIKRGYQAFKNIFRGTPTGQVPGWSPLTTGQKIKSWFQTAPGGKYLAGSPEGRLLSGGAGWAGAAGKKLWGGAKSLASSPLTVGAGAYYGLPWGYKKLFGDDPADAPTPGTGVPGGGDPGMTYTAPGKGKLKELTKAQKDKWADAQRGKRLDNLLNIMGYDASKKTAVADALIDASKIVSDRGTLDRKNITAELINPIIQATSKRLDKPDQIREAVGLMMAKGEIEKDLYKWKPGTHLKNAQDMADTLNIPLAEALNRVTGKANTLGEELAANQTAKRTPLVASEVEQLTRTWADKKKKKLQKTWTATEIKEAGLDKEEAVDIVSKAITGPDDDGLYVVGTEVIEVINGVPKQKW